MILRCPNCNLINPDSALRCDCGYDFPSQTMKRAFGPEGSPSRVIQKSAGRQKMVLGTVIALGGVVITVITHAAANTGASDYYLITWGPILFGILLFGKGLLEYRA